MGDLRALVEARPRAHAGAVARPSGGRAAWTGDPALPVQVGGVDVVAAGEGMGVRNGHPQGTLGEGTHLQRGRLGVRRPERRRGAEQRQIERAGAQGADERGRAALPCGDGDPGMALAQGGERAWHQDGARAGEPAEADRAEIAGQAGQLACARVDLVDDHGRVAQHDPARRGQPDAVVAAFEEGRARGAFERGDLARDGGLRVAEGGGRRGERAALGHLAEHPQGGERGIGEGHDDYAYHR